MRFTLFFAIALLTACHDERPPAPTAADNAELDSADNMLDALANEEGAASEDTAPSNLANESG